MMADFTIDKVEEEESKSYFRAILLTTLFNITTADNQF
jgi:hypothetical protein